MTRKCIPLQVGEAQSLLGNAIDKSHGARHESIIRALAYACLEYGFSNCLKGYCLTPVSFTVVGDIVKNRVPRPVSDNAA